MRFEKLHLLQSPHRILSNWQEEKIFFENAHSHSSTETPSPIFSFCRTATKMEQKTQKTTSI